MITALFSESERGKKGEIHECKICWETKVYCYVALLLAFFLFFSLSFELETIFVAGGYLMWCNDSAFC
jgi:hypothetical protein